MFTPQQTQDGSFTFFSTEFNEAFHSHYGAKQESFLKFAVPTRLPILAETGFVRLLDVCYGLGYNTAAALQTIWQVNPRCRVEVIGLELNPIVPQAAINHQLFNGWDEKYGARPLRRAVERLLEDPLAEAILRNDYNKEEPVIVSVGDKGLVFTQKKSGADTGA